MNCSLIKAMELEVVEQELVLSSLHQNLCNTIVLILKSVRFLKTVLTGVEACHFIHLQKVVCLKLPMH